MPTATPHIGTNSKVTFTPSGGSEVTLKNSDWKLSLDPSIKMATNTTDGIVRAAGLQDATGSVSGFVDTSQVIEADINQGTTGTLKLYRDSTKFFSLTAIIGKLDIETSTEDFEKWSFEFSKQSGSVTEPV